jgi:hypothetical protein
MEGALYLRRSGDAEDVLQLVVHPIHPVGGGYGQSVQKRGRCGHVLASLGKGDLRLPLMVDDSGDIPSLSRGVGEVNCYTLLYLESELAVV